MCLH
jgi:hypothetical protein